MLMYFILFTVVGLVIGFFLPKNVAAVSLVVIAVLWATQYGPFWALVSLAEMGLGFVVSQSIMTKS